MYLKTHVPWSLGWLSNFFHPPSHLRGIHEEIPLKIEINPTTGQGIPTLVEFREPPQNWPTFLLHFLLSFHFFMKLLLNVVEPYYIIEEWVQGRRINLHSYLIYLILETPLHRCYFSGKFCGPPDHGMRGPNDFEKEWIRRTIYH